MPERPRPSSNPKGSADESRLVPLTVAGLVCFVTAVALGYGGWLLFGTHEREEPGRVSELKQSAPAQATPEATPAAPAPRDEPALSAPAGELPVPGGEVALGGEGTGFPLRRVIEKHRENWRERQTREAARREQKVNDEIAAVLHERRPHE